MRLLSCLFFVSTVIAIASGNANATPLSITESTDYSNTSPGSTIGTLDVGVNTIFGGVNAVGDTADYFQLTLPASTDLTTVQFSVLNCCVVETNSTVVFSDWGVFTSGGIFGPFLILGNSTLFASGQVFATGPGTLQFGVTSFTFMLPILSAPFDYRLSLTVTANGTPAPVPEPTSLFLVATGLVGAGARRWRRAA